MRSIAELTEHVRGRGGKVTAQRLLIWQSLRGDVTHPTAEDVYARLKPSAPTLSPATVYNVLNELVEWGDVRRFDAGDGRSHFDPDMHAHAELICMRCHRVTDAPASDADGVHAPVTLPTEIGGYRVVARSEHYYGYCPECRAALEVEHTAQARLSHERAEHA